MGKTDLINPPRSTLYARSTPSEKRHKPSAPIKIPTRQRNALSPTFSPINGPISPELMFDMSPINVSSPDHCLSSSESFQHYSSSVHRSSGYRYGLETSTYTPPFMYPFPRFSVAPTRCPSASDHYAPLRSRSSSLHCSSKSVSPRACSIEDKSPLLHNCFLNGEFDDEYTEPEESAFASRGRSRHSTCGLPSPPSTCYGTGNSARSFTSPMVFEEDEGIYLEEEDRMAAISESSADIRGIRKHFMERSDDRDEKRNRSKR